MSGATPEPRTAVMILVEASWLDNSGKLRSAQARMENRSVHGACIRIKTKLGVGARVYIQSHREQFSGIAKYCRVEGKEFLVGIHKDAVNYPIPKNPMPAKDFKRQTDPQTISQTHPQTDRQMGRETGHLIDVVAEEPVEVGLRTRAEEAGFAAAPEEVKASATLKTQSAASAKRDAQLVAKRGREPRRNNVRSWHMSPSGRTGGDEIRGYIARVEEPIAERLMVQDARRTESPPDEPPRIPPAVMANVPPVDAANVAEQAAAGNGFEKKKAKKGRSIMKLKWFAGDEEEMFGPNGSNNPPNEPVQRAAEAAPRRERAVAKPTAIPSGERAGGFEAELLPVEDIYHAAGITSPRRGYSITKVVEMLRSEHLRGASRELRRAAVLMALDAAGVSVDEVLQDAKVRQEAVDAYATEQRKHAEAQWARKAEENIQIQAELELVKAHYGERIRRNLDGVAREKATFGSWLKMKEQETQGMAEAVEQVLKAPAPAEPPADPLLSVTVSSVTGKPV
jgi:hypothetical protein